MSPFGLAAAGSLAAAASLAVAVPTFVADVEPILARRCQSCHRPGEVAPMSLRTYQEARPWARSIRRAVAAREMPPWFADPEVGRFRNDTSLTPEEIDTIVRWVDGGAPAGEDAALEPTSSTTDGSSAEAGDRAAGSTGAEPDWRIGAPDLVVSMPESFQVPAEGVVDYVYLRMPTGLTEDRWIRAIEVQPGAREVVHHIDVLVCPEGCSGAPDFAALKPGVATILPSSPITEPPEPSSEAWVEGEQTEFLTSFLPGGSPTILPEGYARRLPAGADLVLNIHYTPSGVATADRSRVGFVFAEPPDRRVISYFLDNYSIWIPAGAAEYAVVSRALLAREVELLALTPHMHFRGVGAEVAVLGADGAELPLLRVPRYDFEWQITYELAQPRRLAVGAELRYVLRFDNSASNPANPDPGRDVPWGRQTADEMASLFVTLAVPREVGPEDVFAARSDD